MSGEARPEGTSDRHLGPLVVELPERLSVLVLQLVFYNHPIGHDLNLSYRLGEEVPDEASIWEPVPIRQASGKFRGAHDVSSEHLAS